MSTVHTHLSSQHSGLSLRSPQSTFPIWPPAVPIPISTQWLCMPATLHRFYIFLPFDFSSGCSSGLNASHTFGKTHFLEPIKNPNHFSIRCCPLPPQPAGRPSLHLSAPHLCCSPRPIWYSLALLTDPISSTRHKHISIETYVFGDLHSIMVCWFEVSCRG